MAEFDQDHAAEMSAETAEAANQGAATPLFIKIKSLSRASHGRDLRLRDGDIIIAIDGALNTNDIDAFRALGDDLKAAMAAQNKLVTNSFKVSLTSLESSVMKSMAAIDKKIASNTALQNVASSQAKTKKEIEALKVQTKEIRKLLETQQNRITFP